MIINVKTTRQGDEHNTFLEDFEGFVDGAGAPVSMPFTDNDSNHRHYHVGLAELVAAAPVVETYDKLPSSGIIAMVHKASKVVDSVFSYAQPSNGDWYEWLFDDEHTDIEVRLLHTGGLEVAA